MPGAELGTGLLLDRALERYLRHVSIERGLSTNTIGAYRRDLDAYVSLLFGRGVTTTDAVTSADVAAFVQDLRGRDEAPWYVVGKDMSKNEVYVTTMLDDNRLWHNELQLTDLHWISDKPRNNSTYKVRTRYRAPLVGCVVKLDQEEATLELTEAVRAITPGQSAVLYDGDHVIGGGIIR